MPLSLPETRASLLLRLPNAADVAWDEFVAVCGPLVFRGTRQRGLQPADADDLFQDVSGAVAKQVGEWPEAAGTDATPGVGVAPGGFPGAGSGIR